MNREIIKSTVVKRFFINILIMFSIFPAVSSNANNWVIQNSSVASDLLSVYFLDENTGWVVGKGGVILKTTDSGDNWEIQSSGTEEDLYCVFFVDSLYGWASGTHGEILKSTNGGSTWTTQNSGTIYLLLSINFVNQLTGWASGNGGTILKTTDGGINWEPQNSSFEGTISCLDFVDLLYGWAASSASGYINATVLKTTNGGNNWQVVTVPTIWPFYAVDFIDRNTGWAVGFVESIFKSTDGGNTWNQQPGVSSTPETFYSVSFADDTCGWISGSNGIIARTENGGNNWNVDTSGTSNLLWDVFFVNKYNGWAVGDGGTILKYNIDTDPPETEIVDSPNSHTNETDIYFSWQGTDNVSTNLEFSYFLEGYNSNWSSWSEITSYTFNSLPEGDYIFKVKARDEAGNVDPTPDTKRFNIDTTKPDTFIEGPGNLVNHDSVTFIITGIDNETESDSLRFSHILEGYDNEWSDWDYKNSVHYENLDEGNYTFKASAKDDAGNYDDTPAEYNFTIILTSINEENKIPAEYQLYQNYPNPFNPVTTIKYSIPESGNVKLEIINMLGEIVATPVSKYQGAGNYKINFNADRYLNGISSVRGYASGIYFYKLTTNNFISIKKMILLK